MGCVTEIQYYSTKSIVAIHLLRMLQTSPVHPSGHTQTLSSVHVPLTQAGTQAMEKITTF